jgi:hypothetical protein
MIDAKILSSLVSMRILSQRLEISETKLRYAFIWQFNINKLFTKNWAYLLALLLEKVRKTECCAILPLFYAHLRDHTIEFPEKISSLCGQGPGTEQKRVEDLLNASLAVADKMILAVYSLFNAGVQSIDSRWSEIQSLIPEKF